MIVTDTDRRRVLAAYRRLRATSPNSPETIMRIIRDCAAEWVVAAVAEGADYRPQDARDWRAASDYYNSMIKRPDYWRRFPR